MVIGQGRGELETAIELRPPCPYLASCGLTSMLSVPETKGLRCYVIGAMQRLVAVAILRLYILYMRFNAFRLF